MRFPPGSIVYYKWEDTRTYGRVCEAEIDRNAREHINLAPDDVVAYWAIEHGNPHGPFQATWGWEQGHNVFLWEGNVVQTPEDGPLYRVITHGSSYTRRSKSEDPTELIRELTQDSTLVVSFNKGGIITGVRGKYAVTAMRLE